MATTPILAGFYPDPSICRVENKFFLLNSSFEYVPGLPIHCSEDLINWKLVGHAAPEASTVASPVGFAGASTGLYGPSLRHHEGLFWATTTSLGNFLDGPLITHSKRPEGRWSRPVHVNGVVGIDPDLAWDDEGVCLLTWRSIDPSGISQVDIDPYTGSTLSPARLLWSDEVLGETEGPHLIRRGPWWYLFTAQGGTHTGHGVSVARSRDPRGPFEPCPANPIFSHRSTNHPVQATGHGDVVEMPDGSWAMVYLGIRQHGSFPRYHVLGRETFLAALNWRNDWPVIDEGHFTEPPPPSSFDDDFADLDPRWVSPSVTPTEFATTEVGLTLIQGRFADESEQTRVLCTRIQHHEWDARVLPASGDLAMSLRIDARHWDGIELIGQRVRTRAVADPFDRVFTEHNLPAGAYLAIRARKIAQTARGTRGPDRIALGFEINGEFNSLTELDGRHLSTEVAGGFTGRMLGLESLSSQACITSASIVPR